MKVLVAMEIGVSSGMCVGLVLKLASWESCTRRLLVTAHPKANREFSRRILACPVFCSSEVSWNTEDFIRVHKMVKKSGRYNFEGCKIPIPTAIRCHSQGAQGAKLA